MLKDVETEACHVSGPAWTVLLLCAATRGARRPFPYVSVKRHRNLEIEVTAGEQPEAPGIESAEPADVVCEEPMDGADMELIWTDWTLRDAQGLPRTETTDGKCTAAAARR